MKGSTSDEAAAAACLLGLCGPPSRLSQNKETTSADSSPFTSDTLSPLESPPRSKINSITTDSDNNHDNLTNKCVKIENPEYHLESRNGGTNISGMDSLREQRHPEQALLREVAPVVSRSWSNANGSTRQYQEIGMHQHHHLRNLVRDGGGNFSDDSSSSTASIVMRQSDMYYHRQPPTSSPSNFRSPVFLPHQKIHNDNSTQLNNVTDHRRESSHGNPAKGMIMPLYESQRPSVSLHENGYVRQESEQDQYMGSAKPVDMRGGQQTKYMQHPMYQGHFPESGSDNCQLIHPRGNQNQRHSHQLSTQSFPNVSERQEQRIVPSINLRRKFEEKNTSGNRIKGFKIENIISSISQKPLASSIFSRLATPSQSTDSCSSSRESTHSTANPKNNMIKPTTNLPKSLSFRKICSSCGRSRGEHGELGFGNKCVYQDCGRCGASIDLHMKFNVPMGYMCHLTMDQGARKGMSVMYEKKIKDLTYEAELRMQVKDARSSITESGINGIITAGTSPPQPSAAV